jgi:hypothetical protein
VKACKDLWRLLEALGSFLRLLDVDGTRRRVIKIMKICGGWEMHSKAYEG